MTVLRGAHLKDRVVAHEEMRSGIAVRLLQNIVIEILYGLPDEMAQIPGDVRMIGNLLLRH